MVSDAWLYKKKKNAARMALNLVKSRDFVIFDTETTGLDYGSRIVSIAVINRSGDVLLDELVDPQVPIPEGATNVHGITDELVVGRPTFADLLPDLRRVLHRKRWVVYNLAYDYFRILEPLVHQYARSGYIAPGRDTVTISSRRHFRKHPEIALEHKTYTQAQDATYCAMELYAQFYGEYSEYHGSFTWQKLDNACQQSGIHIEAPAHSALGDCRRTLALIHYLANWHLDQQGVTTHVASNQ